MSHPLSSSLAAAPCPLPQATEADQRVLKCLSTLTLRFAALDTDLASLMAAVPELVRQALRQPEGLAVAVRLDGAEWAAASMPEPPEYVAPLVVQGVRRGSLRLGSCGAEISAEDRRFVDQVALQLSALIAKREAQLARQRLEEQVRRADRLAKIGQLAAGLGHELNEPLANILGFAQLAAATPGLPEAVRRDLARIEAAALHCREIIKKLLIFGRQLPLRWERVALGEILQQVQGLVAASAARQQVAVTIEVEGAPAVRGDASQLLQAVVNLAINAIHAMPSGGTLRLVAQAEGGNAVLLVEDTGIGMGSAVLRQIFQPFFTTKGPDGGTGLGLAVVHGIVSVHGGVIDVWSEPGRGSRFEIVFPLWEEDEALS